jgi:hypothetical protein
MFANTMFYVFRLNYITQINHNTKYFLKYIAYFFFIKLEYFD